MRLDSHREHDWLDRRKIRKKPDRSYYFTKPASRYLIPTVRCFLVDSGRHLEPGNTPHPLSSAMRDDIVPECPSVWCLKTQSVAEKSADSQLASKIHRPITRSQTPVIQPSSAYAKAMGGNPPCGRIADSSPNGDDVPRSSVSSLDRRESQPRLIAGTRGH